MNLLLVSLIVLSAVVSCQAACVSNCLVDLPPFGQIQGKCSNSICSFTNIPYALSPTGARRFEAPIPYNETWSDIRDGTQQPIGAIQFSISHEVPIPSEDSLYVNVYIPGTVRLGSASFAVRAYIHGGGFMFGEAGDTDPSFLVKNQIVVVLIGYRLGPLGFLSTGDNCIPGNNGLKDQREALRWIKKYIAYFNGNPNRVLLTGFSAGGASSHLHMLRKENLFSAVMANNGVAFNPWVFQTKPYVQYTKFLQILNCPTLCASAKACIKGKSVQDIRNAVNKMKVFRDNPFNVFGAVVEDVNVRDAFITSPPEDIIKSGKSSSAPFLIAYTEREGSYNAADLMNIGPDGKPLITLLNDTTWLKYAPNMLFYNNTLPASLLNNRSIELRKQYMGNKPFTGENYRLLEDMFSDLLYVNGMKRAICLHRKYAAGKLYVYVYKYPHTYGVGNLMSNRDDYVFGADHGADGIFTLPLLVLKQDTLTANELKVANRLAELYKSLANGSATYDGIQLPVNTPSIASTLTINEYCHDVEYCNDANCGDCSQFI